MSPRSLLFSSDQETSHQLTRTLQELSLDVEASHEIFAALRLLTSKAFSVLAVDWDDGLEASFLLKTARESKANHNLFAIVVGKAAARAALEHAGADLVLSKPLRPDRIRHALLTCEAFTSRQITAPHISGPPAPPTHPSPPLAPWPQTQPLPAKAAPQAKPVPGWPTASLPSSTPDLVAQPAPIHLSFATFGDGLTGDSGSRKTLRPKRVASFPPVMRRSLLLRSAAIGAIFFVVGYVFSRPLSTMTAAFASTPRESLQNPQSVNQPSSDVIQAEAMQPQDITLNTTAESKSGAIRITPVRNSKRALADFTSHTPAPIPQSAALQEPSDTPGSMATETPSSRSANIPESLGSPFPGLNAAREVASEVKPALMDALRPVSIPGALSEKMLLDKIVPNYPEQALRSGLRGPVVLQAWIGKDGRILELKLVRGPLLLGEAAFDAVRNWRYKPYLLNGEAVEAQTQVTVDFKLP